MRVGLPVTVDLVSARIGMAATLRRHGGRRVNDTPAERGAESTWARLRRRKVVQWSVAYVAAAWALLQGLEFLADIYDWPTAFLRVVTLALALGLPIVVTLAWYHGDRGEQRVGGTELSIVAVLFLLGGGVVWYYQRTADTTTVATPRPRLRTRSRPMHLSRCCPS